MAITGPISGSTNRSRGLSGPLSQNQGYVDLVSQRQQQAQSYQQTYQPVSQPQQSLISRAKNFFTPQKPISPVPDEMIAKPQPKTLREKVTGFIAQAGSILKSVSDSNIRSSEIKQRWMEGFGSGVLGSTSSLVDSFTKAYEVKGEKIKEKKGETPKSKTLTKASSITRKVSNKIKRWSDELSPENPTFIDSLTQGTGSMATFAFLNVLTKGSTIAPVLAESLMESGTVYEENRKKGMPISEASKRADRTFFANLAVNYVTDKFGVFGDRAKGIKKALISAPLEGIQESLQQIISNIETDRETMAGVFESMGVGSILGGVFALILPGKQIKAFKKGQSGDVTTGPVSADEAMEFVLKNELGKTPNGKKIVKAVVEAKATNEDVAITFGEKGNVKSVEVGARQLTATTDLLVAHEGTETKTVDKYKEEIRSGKTVEPLKVIREGEKYGVDDGKNRLQAYKDLGVKDVPIEIVEAKKVVKPKETDLTTEARKYKSAEEFVKAFNEKTKDVGFGDDVRDFPGVEINRQFIETAQQPKYQKMYEAGKKDVDILTDIYNQAKGVGGDLATEARKYKSAEELIKEWDDGFWKINKQAKIVGVPINEIGNKITTRQKSVTEKGVLEWIDKIKNGERPTILVGIRENLTKGKIGKRPLEPTVLDGYHRLEAYRRLGFKEVPVLDNTPKSQLTSIYNQAKGVGVKPKKKIVTVPREQVPVGVGKKKVSRLEARVKQTLDNVSQEQIDKLGLATYNQMNKKDNIRLASEYVLNNPQEALEVLKGNKSAPKGILRNSIYVAMENMAKGDVELARKLATLEATRFGQELSILTELDKDSPVKAMQDIIQVRRRAIERKTGKKVDQLVKNETAKIKKEVSNKYNWGAFLKEIRC